jgi:hypothetical protein
MHRKEGRVLSGFAQRRLDHLLGRSHEGLRVLHRLPGVSLPSGLYGCPGGLRLGQAFAFFFGRLIEAREERGVVVKNPVQDEGRQALDADELRQRLAAEEALNLIGQHQRRALHLFILRAGTGGALARPAIINEEGYGIEKAERPAILHQVLHALTIAGIVRRGRQAGGQTADRLRDLDLTDLLAQIVQRCRIRVAKGLDHPGVAQEGFPAVLVVALELRQILNDHPELDAKPSCIACGGFDRLHVLDRVAWTETRNLASDDPQVAQRIMIATARQADALKAAAGVKPTGRKATAGPVLTYSLAWHPNEREGLTREEMLRAADASLRVLGAQDHQALIVCHTDRSHPHLHIVLCRVHPVTGKMLSASNDYRKLSAWAHDYEKFRGAILTPARAKNAEAWAQKRRDEPAADNRRRQDARNRDAPQEAGSGAARPGETVGSIADLKALSAAQKMAHRAAWTALAARHKAARAAAYDKATAQIAGITARHRTEARPLWAQYFSDRRAEARDHARLERSPLGIVALAMTAAREQRARGEAGGRGLLMLAIANILSPALRRATFAAALARDRLALAGRLKGRLDAEIDKVKTARTEALDRHHRAFLRERAALIAAQSADRTKLRAGWQQATSRSQAEARPVPAPERQRQPSTLFDQLRSARTRERSQARSLGR